MRKASDYIEAAYSMFHEGADRALMFRTAEDETVDGRTIRLGGKDLVTFGSGSYLGLELDQRLKEGAIDATRRYGTQFPSSRAYVSAPLYRELEALLETIYGVPAVIGQNTTLCNQAALPVLIEEGDGIVIDQQAHFCVHQALNLVRVRGGVRVEMIRHNRMDLLEEQIRAMRGVCRRIWYLADGVYSMFGDFMPVPELSALLRQYEQLHLFVDDAHGMSWYGKNGRGYAMHHLPNEERMVVSASLNKAFAAAGGTLVTHNAEWRRKFLQCASPLIYSGPIQPPMLGAAVASARLHLTPEFDHLQRTLQEHLVYCNELLVNAGLPLVSPAQAPIRFVGMGLPRVTFNMAGRLIEEGFFANPAIFPLVPNKKTGLRFTVTSRQKKEDIARFVAVLAKCLPEALAEENISMAEVRQMLDLDPQTHGAEATSQRTTRSAAAKAAEDRSPTLEHHRSCETLDSDEWDALLGTNGSYSCEGMRFLERTFQGNPEAENNWDFHYYVVRDAERRPILATFFTKALWKDDMLAPREASRLLEERRKVDPYFLCSSAIAMGSLLSEGSHLHLDRGADWKSALRLLLRAVFEEQRRSGAKSIIFRDFPSNDAEFHRFMQDEGFVKFDMYESYAIELAWDSDEAFMAELTQNGRRHMRKNVFAWEPAYRVEVLRHGGRTVSAEELEHFYQLYLQVKSNGLLINTFALPRDIYAKILASPAWELLALHLRPEFGGVENAPPVAIIACFVGPEGEQYVPMFVGMDYRYLQTHQLYRQVLLRCIRRARELGRRRLYLGFTAGLEKRRFGAKPIETCIYVQSDEHYNMEVLGQIMADAATTRSPA